MIKKKGKEIELYPDFYVSGVWISDKQVTTHLYLHKVVNGVKVALGDKVSVEEAIKLLDRGVVIRTMRWSYIRAEWVTGVLLKTVTLDNGGRLIKSGSGNVVTDNLEHLIMMHLML